MSFPFSPYNGQLYTNALGTSYRYDAARAAWLINSQTIVGLTGVQGLTGPQGYQGNTGVQGNTGLPGLPGNLYAFRNGQWPTPSYSGAVDTYMNQATPTINYEATGYWILSSNQAGSNSGGLLRFDLSAMPSNLIVTNVVLGLTTTSYSQTVDSFFNIYQSRRAWNSSQATWNVYATGNSWTTAGAQSTVSDIYSTSLGIIHDGGSINTYYETILNASGVAVVQGWVSNPASNNGFVIETYNNVTNVNNSFYDSDQGSVYIRPILYVYTQGIQGVTGVQGVIGIQGNTGVLGQTGVQGQIGIPGTTGVQGNTGIQGNIGTLGQTGVQGLIGIQGNTGVQGTQGQTGLQGRTGIQGQTGVQGQTGLSGDRYSTFSSSTMTIGNGTKHLYLDTGLAYTLNQQVIISDDYADYMMGSIISYDNTTGETFVSVTSYAGSGTYSFWTVGLNGAQGAQGVTGPQGLTGVQGGTGSQGLQGVQGAQGNVGSQGATGLAGPQGNQGPTGLQGRTGLQGQGIQGNTGIQGVQGNVGLQGSQGATGPGAVVNNAYIPYAYNGSYAASYLYQTGSSVICSGNLGIGTSPIVPLDIRGAPYIGLIVRNNGGIGQDSYLAFNPNNGLIATGQHGSAALQPLALGVNGSENMRISTSGNIGIGNLVPGCKLDVSGDINLSTSGGTGIKLWGVNGDNNIIQAASDRLTVEVGSQSIVLNNEAQTVNISSTTINTSCTQVNLIASQQVNLNSIRTVLNSVLNCETTNVTPQTNNNIDIDLDSYQCSGFVVTPHVNGQGLDVLNSNQGDILIIYNVSQSGYALVVFTTIGQSSGPSVSLIPGVSGVFWNYNGTNLKCLAELN